MMLQILVCVKQVLDARLPLIPAPSGRGVLQEEIHPVYTFNPLDRCALEAALWLKEKYGAQVTALTVGEERASEVLQACLGYGADAATLLVKPEDICWDVWQSAGVVADELKNNLPDLVLCGDVSMDKAEGAFGPFLAEHLAWPQVTRGEWLEPSGEGIVVRRQLERGAREIVVCPLPVVVCMQAWEGGVRYLSELQVSEAPQEKIERRMVGLSGPELLAGLEMSEISLPRPRPRRMAAPAATLSAAQRLSFMMSGGQQKKDSGLFEGTPEQAAERIFNFLKEQGFI
jgi:electron transfer flavoprotein beta subunit